MKALLLPVMVMSLAAAAQPAPPDPPTGTAVNYEQFGAAGDGKTDDMAAIAAAHAYANQHGLPVRTAPKTYYIRDIKKTAVIKTDTDFGETRFVIDDRDVFKERRKSVFSVESSHRHTKLKELRPLKRNQANIGFTLNRPALIRLVNANVKHYIRYGLNQNSGSSQTDIILVDRDGTIDPSAPLIWDFDAYTDVTLMPVDEKRLTISGGHFTTIANQAESKYTYYARNIAIRRSNVHVTGLRHDVTGEGDHGAPYTGFLAITSCANVLVENCILTGHKTYRTIGSAGKPVNMGSYDLSPGSAINVTFKNCRQTNSIHDRTYWGILGSNYCKNLTYDGCVFSRFDAHMGVANATIRNSELGYMGINAIGSGTLLIENTRVSCYSMVNFRSDYGSTWEGNLIIRNCTLAKASQIFGGNYTGKHDFGYPCFMPETILIDGLKIEDGAPRDGWKGLPVFGNFNPKATSDQYVETYPYHRTKELILQNVTTDSGVPVRLSDNPYFFKDVRVTAR